MAKKKEETAKKTEKKDSAEQYEQSTWSVRINSQTLYKKPVAGRTILFGITKEENEKIAQVLDKAFADLSEILEKRTTMHKASEEKGQVTRVDTTGADTVKNENAKVDDTKETSEGGAKKKENSETRGEDDSLLDKLRS